MVVAVSCVGSSGGREHSEHQWRAEEERKGRSRSEIYSHGAQGWEVHEEIHPAR